MNFFAPLSRIHKLSLLLAAFSCPLLACEPEERADFYMGDDTVSAVERTPGTVMPLTPSQGTYPLGPYGSNNPEVGETLADLAFFGFHRLGYSKELISEGDYGETSFSDYRDSGANYLLIHVAAAWCSSCLLGAIDLQAAASEIVAGGGELLELIVDGQGVGVDPTKNELELWAEYGGLRFTTSGPGADQTREVFPEREHVYIVDLQSMKVVWTEEGLYNNPSVAQLGIEQLLGTYLPR